MISLVVISMECSPIDSMLRISDETRGLTERLLLARLSWRGICRAVRVGLTWFLGFIVNCFEMLPAYLPVEPITSNADVVIQRLEVEADAMARFVPKKMNKQWIWRAMDAKSRQIIGLHVGDGHRKSARKLWATVRKSLVNRRRFIRTSMGSMSESCPLHSTTPSAN